MATDAVVTAKDIMEALMRVRRVGVDPLLRELEQREPDLAEIVLEEISAVHHRLGELGAPAKQTRRLVRRIESLVLVCIAAVRQGQRRLWEQTAADAAEPPPALAEPDAGAGTANDPDPGSAGSGP